MTSPRCRPSSRTILRLAVPEGGLATSQRFRSTTAEPENLSDVPICCIATYYSAKQKSRLPEIWQRYGNALGLPHAPSGSQLLGAVLCLFGIKPHSFGHAPDAIDKRGTRQWRRFLRRTPLGCASTLSQSNLRPSRP